MLVFNFTLYLGFIFQTINQTSFCFSLFFAMKLLHFCFERSQVTSSNCCRSTSVLRTHVSARIALSYCVFAKGKLLCLSIYSTMFILHLYSRRIFQPLKVTLVSLRPPSLESSKHDQFWKKMQSG